MKTWGKIEITNFVVKSKKESNNMEKNCEFEEISLWEGEILKIQRTVRTQSQPVLLCFSTEFFELIIFEAT